MESDETGSTRTRLLAYPGAAERFGGLLSDFLRRIAIALALGHATSALADHVRGAWSPVGAWPLIAIHAVLTPDGRVLTYGSDLADRTGFFYDVWDPAAGGVAAGHVTLPNAAGTDIFCSSQILLPETGQVFIAGGDNYVNGVTTLTGNNNTNVFTPGINNLARGRALNRARWYSTATTLLNGEIYIQGGAGGKDRPEIRSAGGAFRVLTAANTNTLNSLYPRNFVAPDGRIFGFDIAGRMYSVDPLGTGLVTVGGQLPGATAAGSSAVMFRPGRILQIGGASANAYVIRIDGASPSVSATQPNSSQRQWVNATVLADGKVLATGGSAVDTAVSNELRDVNNTAELWDPDASQWMQGAAGQIPRLYHSMALLLPDASVLVAGGGLTPLANLNAEIYYPPYLYDGNDVWAARPTITSAPAAINIGETFALGVDAADGVSRVTLVKSGSVTHSFNMDQRFMELAFTVSSGGLTVHSPASAADAPPGYYLLFAFDAHGVPSIAKIVRMNIAGTSPPPVIPPVSLPALVLDPMPAVTPQLTDASITYTASVNDATAVRFSWYFDDGTAPTSYSSSPTISHTFAKPGIYYVAVTAKRDGEVPQTQTFTQMVHLPVTSRLPSASSSIAYEPRATGRVWLVNPDRNTVSVFHAGTNNRIAEIAVGAAPRAVAIAPGGRIWVVNKLTNTISVIDPGTLAVVKTVTLPYASQPFGLAFSPTQSIAFVTLEAGGKLLKLDAVSGAQLGSVDVGANPRHVSVTGDGSTVYVSRFITPPLPGESTTLVQPDAGGVAHGGEVVEVAAAAMVVTRTIVLHVSTKLDLENQGGGVPNYLGATVISPDGTSAWVPSKQDNVLRGTQRNGSNLNFQSTVRAVSSRLDLKGGQEDFAARLDHDNSGVASAAAFDPYGVYLFVALETSREVAVVDAYGGWEIFRFDVGRAPQGLVVSPDGKRLYVGNYMDRTLQVFDLTRLIGLGESNVPIVATVKATATETLSAKVLKGKQLFYDARDTRLARDGYLSCAACHNDGGHDGRVWDLTGFGEGLRNTIALRGRAGGQGFLHWSGNFDEVQDFEGQIRSLAGGTGLVTDAAFNTGTRSQPLGDKKAGISADLDALAAYVASLATFDKSPRRTSSGTLTAAANAGKNVFIAKNCAQCHKGSAFTDSAAANLHDIGTLKPTSGNRLGGALAGIDAPTLRDVWATAPYLHDGSAPALADAITAHAGVTLSATELANLTAYVEQIGSLESTAPADTTVPSIPTLFKVALVTRKPQLSWASSTDNIGVAGYVVYRSTTAATQGPEIARVPASPWRDASAVAGTTYTYALKAYDAAGNLSGRTGFVSIKAQ